MGSVIHDGQASTGPGTSGRPRHKHPPPLNGRAWGRHPARLRTNSQDLTNRGNPQDMTVPRARNPQDLTR